ncbi:MAG: hypothetical protein ACRCVN_04735 [Spirochaetia bacterium]
MPTANRKDTKMASHLGVMTPMSKNGLSQMAPNLAKLVGKRLAIA